MNIFYTKKRFTSYPRAENFKKLSRIKVRCEFKKKKKDKGLQFINIFYDETSCGQSLTAKTMLKFNLEYKLNFGPNF